MLGFSDSFSVDRVGHGSGLAIMWKRSLSCTVVNSSTNHIDFNIMERNSHVWRITFFMAFLREVEDRSREFFSFFGSNISALLVRVW